MPLDDQGFDPSMLVDFRQRLLAHGTQDLLLEPILQVCREHKWLKAGGKQRTDSSFVLAKVRGLSSLESVGESLRAALNELAEVEPDWLLTVIRPDWFDRYVHRFELQRFPKGEQAKEDVRRQVGEDSWQLLPAATREHAPQSVQACPSVARLQQVWTQHFERVEGLIRWRDGPAVQSAERVISPYETDARASRKRETEWVGDIRASDRDLWRRRRRASDRPSTDHGCLHGCVRCWLHDVRTKFPSRVIHTPGKLFTAQSQFSHNLRVHTHERI